MVASSDVCVTLSAGSVGSYCARTPTHQAHALHCPACGRRRRVSMPPSSQSVSQCSCVRLGWSETVVSQHCAPSTAAASSTRGCSEVQMVDDETVTGTSPQLKLGDVGGLDERNGRDRPRRNDLQPYRLHVNR